MSYVAKYGGWALRTRFVAGLHKLERDRDGSALIYTTVALPALMGLALLAIDGSRFMNMHTSLQHAVDALALAGAGELDRLPNACTRAVRAMENLVQNDQRFGSAGLSTITIDDVSYRFLSELPVNDSDPIPSSMVVDPCDDLTARFLEVTVDPQNFVTLFPAAFIGASPTATGSATAVAGFDFAICKFAPIFLCNPWEPAGNTDPYRTAEIIQHVNDPQKRKQQIRLKAFDGAQSQWSPGNYGFLESELGPGANALGEAVASTNPPVCFLQNEIYTKTGNTNTLRHAFNVRFDLYHGSYSRTNPEYVPAPNVRKGFAYDPTCPNNDGPDIPPNMGLPRDRCFAGGPCGATDRFGLGDWDEDNDGISNFESYWTTNFGTSTPFPRDENGVAYSNSYTPSRYDIYKYEITNNLLGPPPAGAVSQERGAPHCHANAAGSLHPDRRLMTGAILNCIAHPISTGTSGGPYPAAAFGDFFLTEPMGVKGTNDSLWVELVEVVVTNETNSKAKDLTQLYR